MGTVMGARNVSAKGLRQNERLHRLNAGACLSSLSVVILFPLALDWIVIVLDSFLQLLLATLLQDTTTEDSNKQGPATSYSEKNVLISIQCGNFWDRITWTIAARYSRCQLAKDQWYLYVCQLCSPTEMRLIHRVVFVSRFEWLWKWLLNVCEERKLEAL